MQLTYEKLEPIEAINKAKNSIYKKLISYCKQTIFEDNEYYLRTKSL